MTFPDAAALCRMCGFAPRRHTIKYYEGWGTALCSHEQISDLDFRVVREALVVEGRRVSVTPDRDVSTV